jgi:D-alanine-D-alanine ligase
MGKLRVGVLFGGRSGEHEVSLRSAASVIAAMDERKYEVVPIGITKQGRWLTGGAAERLLHPASARALAAGDAPGGAVLGAGDLAIAPPAPDGRLQAFQTAAADKSVEVDVVFPVLHGTFGEDGTIQGLLELAEVAYVGAGVLGSSAGMDKDVMKRLFRDAGLPIVRHLTVLRVEWESAAAQVAVRVAAELRYPLFVKPANLGSSVGISKVHDAGELAAAMNEAALYDRKIVIEEGVGGRKARELECAVLGNDDPKASVVGEVVPSKEFYDYDAKYIDEGSTLSIPARLTAEQTAQVRAMAVQAFQAVDASGLGRIDFLMDPATEEIFVNEINTMPGFTSISMYPKLWAATGVAYPELIDRLIQLGLERHAEKKRNRYTK